MKEKPIIFSAPMVLALLCGRKTVTRRFVNACIDKAKPPCEAGDILWVRESWRTVSSLNNAPPSAMPKSSPIEYMATSKGVFPESRTRSPLHMPRWASRITLRVKAVRMERLHDISEDDCLREGVIDLSFYDIGGMFTTPLFLPVEGGCKCSTARHAYGWLWNEIHGNGAWENNPRVWRIEFEVSNEKAL